MENTNLRKTLQKPNTTQKKANNTNKQQTKPAWFSRLIWHSARKRGGLILQCSRDHTGLRHVGSQTCSS